MYIRRSTDLGLAIRELRKSKGISQMDLAKKANISRQWIIEIEKGKSTAEIGKVFRVVAALDVRIKLEDSSEQISNKKTKNLSSPYVDINAIANGEN